MILWTVWCHGQIWLGIYKRQIIGLQRHGNWTHSLHQRKTLVIIHIFVTVMYFLFLFYFTTMGKRGKGCDRNRCGQVLWVGLSKEDTRSSKRRLHVPPVFPQHLCMCIPFSVLVLSIFSFVPLCGHPSFVFCSLFISPVPHFLICNDLPVCCNPPLSVYLKHRWVTCFPGRTRRLLPLLIAVVHSQPKLPNPNLSQNPRKSAKSDFRYRNKRRLMGWLCLYCRAWSLSQRLSSKRTHPSVN